MQIQKLGNIASCQYFPDVETNNNRKLKLMMRLMKLYKPYALFKGMYVHTCFIFDYLKKKNNTFINIYSYKLYNPLITRICLQI